MDRPRFGEGSRPIVARDQMPDHLNGGEDHKCKWNRTRTWQWRNEPEEKRCESSDTWGNGEKQLLSPAVDLWTLGCLNRGAADARPAVSRSVVFVGLSGRLPR